MSPQPLRNRTGQDFQLDWEDISGRGDPQQRFRIYCRAHDGTLTLLATCATAEAVGVAIVTMGRESAFQDCALGILDSFPEEGQPKWVILPWEPHARGVSAAGRVLAKAPRKETRRP